MLLARVRPVVSQLVACLPLAGVTEARVDIAGRGTAESVGRGGLGGFLAVVTLDGGVVGLARHFRDGVGGEGAVGGGGAGGKGFGAE